MSKNADNRGAENQRILFSYVKKIYPNLEVLYEFLLPNGMRYDIFIPALGICIEYDGEQHFRPIEFFGGIESFKNLILKDELKNLYCQENNLSLLRISYKENINKKLGENIIIKREKYAISRSKTN